MTKALKGLIIDVQRKYSPLIKHGKGPLGFNMVTKKGLRGILGYNDLVKKMDPLSRMSYALFSAIVHHCMANPAAEGCTIEEVRCIILEGQCWMCTIAMQKRSSGLLVCK